MKKRFFKVSLFILSGFIFSKIIISKNAKIKTVNKPLFTIRIFITYNIFTSDDAFANLRLYQIITHNSFFLCTLTFPSCICSLGLWYYRKYKRCNQGQIFSKLFIVDNVLYFVWKSHKKLRRNERNVRGSE